MKANPILLTITLLLGTVYAMAQSFSVKGRITDAKNEEALIGATVLIKGTTNGASTNFDGNYEIRSVQRGSYTLVVSYISYKTKEIPITVAGDQVLNVRLDEAIQELTGVVISTTRRANSEMSAISDMKKAEMVVNSISAQSIAKTPDRDVAQVIKRIPGITISDDRFVVVRGLATRYNTVMLNGVIAPSTEADSRAFSFDVVPSNFLDRLSVFKSGSPELPGEFGGAVIKIYTKNIVEENFTSFNYTVGYRAGTTFKKFNSDPSANRDAIGMGRAERELPGDFPKNLRDYTFDFARLEKEGRRFDNNFTVEEGTAIPDQRFRLDFGRMFKIKNIDVSTLNSLNYSNTFVRQNIARDRFINYRADGSSDLEYAYKDDKSENNVRMGLISNWALNLNSNNKVEFRNLYTQLGSSEVTIRNGIRGAKNSNEERNYSWRYQTRNIYTSQLSGLHILKEDKARINWTTGLTLGNRFEPDWRRSQERRPIGSEEDFAVDVPSNATSQSAARFNTSLKENSVVASLDYELKTGKDEQNKIRAGFYTERKAREFNARSVGYISTSRTSQRILDLPTSEIFAPENVSLDSGLLLAENTKYTDTYLANSLLGAVYLGSSFVFNAFSLSGGVRGEYNRQQLETAPNAAGVPETVDNPVFNILPFINMGYALSEKTQLRFSYGITVNRPEFRELAPFTFYNFDLTSDVVGNKGLKTCVIHNIDARYEIYPKAGEVVTLGVFYKSFINPIEFIITTGADNPIFIYSNAKSAFSYGVELETRKNLGFVGSADFFQNLNMVFNASLIKSRINLGANNLTQASERPLQGQSPYVVNAGVYYQSQKGVSASVLYNVYGKRIFLVGDNEYPTSYEMPRNIIDLSFAKKFGENTELRFTVNDLLNAPYKVAEDANRDLKTDNGITDKNLINTRAGAYYTLGVTYKF